MDMKFTQEQFQLLMEMAYITNRTVGTKKQDHLSDYEDLTQYILSYAKDFGLENLVSYDEESKKYVTTEDFTIQLNRKTRTPEEEVFLDQLASRLGSRDALEEADREDKLDKVIEQKIHYHSEYLKEFKTFKTDRLYVVTSEDVDMD
ncbi:hypothetical protein [Halobacillus sp. B29]|uniref:hypothetical protein n=1 Tax=Halobacillus sp. B29 TaxID=3457432 RepID=UPI003FCD01E5